MALDKLVNSTALDTGLTSIANAIRTKGGTSEQLTFPEGFVDAVEDIPTGGGGGGGAAKNDVTFYDYDGTITNSYSASEFASLAALPANPSHEGLIAQGWNWGLADAKTYVAKYGKLNIGQMYVTQSGATEIDVEMPEGRLEPILTICVDGTITVDWGDDTTPDTVTGSSLSTRLAVLHTYASEGNYTISILATGNNKYSFYGTSQYLILRKNLNSNENRAYANTVKHIRIGNNAEINDSAFYNCYSLSSVTIPDWVTRIGNSAFSNCYSLSSITIPDGVTSIGNNAFYCSYSFSSITIPNGITSIETYAISSCNAFSGIAIPDSVTSIGAGAFSTCPSIPRITIPDRVTSIGNNAFSSCYGLKEVHIFPTTVPTGGTNMFSNIVSDCIIYVPKGHLNDYQTATNWSTYASYMQEEPE